MWKRPSTWLAIVLAAAFGLQWFPQTGLYMMFFGAAIWTGWLFLALLLAVGVEAASGRLPRIFLALPLAVIASYYLITIAQRSQVAALVQDTAMHNAVPVGADGLKGRDLLFAQRGALWNDRIAVAALMSKYAVSTAYIDTSGARNGNLMDRLDVAEQCLPPATPIKMPDLGFQPLNICVTEQLPLEANGKVVLGIEIDRSALWGTELVTTTYPITFDGEDLGSASALQASFWPYLPQPLIGCGLVSGGSNAGWRCAAVAHPQENFEWPAELLAAGRRFIGERDLTPIAEKLGLPLRAAPAESL